MALWYFSLLPPIPDRHLEPADGERWAGAPSVRWNSQTKAHLHLKKQRVYATETLDYATKTSPPACLSAVQSGGERGWLAGVRVRGKICARTVMCWALKTAIWISRLLCAPTPRVSVSLLLPSPLTFYGSYIWEGRVWYCGCMPRLSVSLSVSPRFPLSMISIFSLSPSLSLTLSLSPSPSRVFLCFWLISFIFYFFFRRTIASFCHRNIYRGLYSSLPSLAEK